MPAPDVIEVLRLRFDAREFPLGVELSASALTDAVRTLRDGHGYRYYVTGTATDRDSEIEVTHGLRNLDSGDDLFVKVRLPKPGPEVDSIALLFAGAEWFEREILDLFGVTFRAHPDPRRILMPDEYEGHPLLKDFPMETAWGYRPPSETEEV